MAQVAERATCSPLTAGRIEKGTPTVAIGIYLRVLYALQLDDDILLLAKEDTMGRALQDLCLKSEREHLKRISHETTICVFADFDWLKAPRLIGELSYESLRGSDSYGFLL